MPYAAILVPTCRSKKGSEHATASPKNSTRNWPRFKGAGQPAVCGPIEPFTWNKKEA